MATDLTEVLLRRQADRYNTDRFGQRPDLLSDAGGNWNAGNFVQGVNQGIGNLLGAINAPAAREEAARQEAIAAEQVQYSRDQDALAHELAKATGARADRRLGLDEARLKKQGEREELSDLLKRNTAQAELSQLEQQGELDKVLKAQGNKLNSWVKQGYLVPDPNVEGGVQLTPEGEAAGIATEFSSMVSAADQIAQRNQESARQRLILAADADPSNDYGKTSPFRLPTATEDSTVKYDAKDAELKKVYDEGVKGITGKYGNAAVEASNEYTQFAKDWKGGSVEDVIAPFIDVDKSEESPSFQREEATSIFNRINDDPRVKALPEPARDLIFRKVMMRGFGQGWGWGDYSDSRVDGLVDGYVGPDGLLTKGIKMSSEIEKLDRKLRQDAAKNRMFRDVESGKIKLIK